MASLRPSEAIEIDYNSEAGLFFRRLGEIAISPQTSEQDKKAPLNASRIAVASQNGVIIYCDSTAVYVVRSSDLLANLQKWNNSDEALPRKNVTEIGGVAVPLSGANIISLAPQGDIFAVGTTSDIRIYSIAAVLEKQQGFDTPLRCDSLDGSAAFGILDIQWRPQQNSTEDYIYAALVPSQVHLVNITSGTVTQLRYIPINISCISWNPDGTMLAVGADDNVTLYEVDSNGTASTIKTSVQVISQDAVEDEGQSLVIEGLRWLSSTGGGTSSDITNSILVLSRLLEDGSHTDLAPWGIISWPQGSIPTDASQITMAEFFAINVATPNEIEEESNFTFSDGRSNPPPCLVSATVQEWGATVITHLHAFDDHIKIFEQQGQDLLQGVDVTDDKLAIRIPNAPGDANNYVVGLGFDVSYNGAGSVVVQHPTDETAPDLKPQPVLWVATSDGVLRAYTFGRTKERANVVEMEPKPLPAAPKLVGSTVSQAGEDGEKEKKSSVESIIEVAAAAAAALPESESDFEEEQEVVEIAPASIKEPEKKPLFGFAAPVTAAAVTPSAPPAPAFSFSGGPPSLGQPPSFGFGASAAAATTTTTSVSSVATNTPSSLFTGPSKGPIAAPSSSVSSQPPLPSFGQIQQAQALKAKIATAAPAAAATPSLPKPTVPAPAPRPSAFKRLPFEKEEKTEEVEEQQQQQQQKEEKEQRPARSQTAIISPAARLQDYGDEAAMLERDFLISLEETRSLEASIHDAIADALSGADAVTGSHADFEKLRQHVYNLQAGVTTASETLAGLRGEFEALALGVKEGYMRMEAMPAFQPDDDFNNQQLMSSNGGRDTNISTVELRRKQPLDPSLGALRDSARAHLRALSQKLDELKECVSALEDNHRRARTGKPSRQSQVASTPQAQAFALYEAINAQNAVIQAQTAKLDDLAASIKGSGIMMRIDSLDLDALLLGGGSTDDFNVHFDDDGVDFQHNQKLGLVVKRSSSVSPASSSLVHIDSSKKSRVPWQSVRTSPAVVRRLSSSSSQVLASPLSLSSPRGGRVGGGMGSGVDARGVAWKGGAQGDALARDILRRFKGLEGGIRVTEVSGMPTTPPLKGQSVDNQARDRGAKSVLPPLKPLVLPELPKPYMPAPAPAIKAAPSTTTRSSSMSISTSASKGSLAAAAAAKSSASSGFKLGGGGPPAAFGAAAAPAAPSLIPKPKPATSKSSSLSGSQQPPLPSFAQVKAASALKANVLGGKESAAGSGSAAVPKIKLKPSASSSSTTSSSQPPLPSFGQLAAAQDLQAKAAAAKAAEARMTAFSAAPAAEKKEESEKKADTTSAPAAEGLNLGSFGFGTTTSTTTAATESATTAATSSSPFGKGISAFGAPATASTATLSSFGAPASSAAAAATTTTTTPFGALSTLTPASSSASIFGSAAATSASTPTPSLFGAAPSSSAAGTSSPFGTPAATSGFGAPTAFGAAASTPAAAVASPFGTPSGFGAAASSSASASQPAFGAAFGAPASPAGAFGAAAASTGGGGGLFGAAPGASPAAGGAFGQPPAFGKPSAFGQPSAFGAAATPATVSAFGQPAAFGQAASPVTAAFGQGAAPAASTVGGFGSFATQPSGFSSFAQQSGAAPTGFGAMARGGGTTPGGFGTFGGGPAAPPKPAGGANMWAPRK